MIKLRWKKLDGDMISAYAGFGITYDLETKTFDIVRIANMTTIQRNLSYTQFAIHLRLLVGNEYTM